MNSSCGACGYSINCTNNCITCGEYICDYCVSPCDICEHEFCIYCIKICDICGENLCEYCNQKYNVCLVCGDDIGFCRHYELLVCDENSSDCIHKLPFIPELWRIICGYL